MNIFTRSLWPASVRSPYTRLLVALGLAPFLFATLLTIAAFLVAGMSEPTREAAIDVTIDSGLSLFALTYIYTLTFGLVGIMILWALAQRGIFAWAVCGAVTGAIASMVFGEAFLEGTSRGLVIAFAFGGWMIYLLIRRIAGIQDDDTAAD